MPDHDLSTFAGKLSAELEAQCLSPEDLARRLAIRPRSVHEWCRGDSRPRDIEPALDALRIGHTDRPSWRDLGRVTCGPRNWEGRGPLSGFLRELMARYGGAGLVDLEIAAGIDASTVAALLRGRKASAATLRKLFAVHAPAADQIRAILDYCGLSGTSLGVDRLRADRDRAATAPAVDLFDVPLVGPQGCETVPGVRISKGLASWLKANQPPSNEIVASRRNEPALIPFDPALAALMSNLGEALALLGRIGEQLRDHCNRRHVAAPTPAAEEAA